MQKKNKKIDKASREKGKKKENDSSSDSKTEETFDFGGLPDRNIKKNLGCG